LKSSILMKRSLRYKAVVSLSLMIIFSLLIFQCSYRDEQSTTSDNYSRFLSEIGIQNLPSKLMIVPTQGCGPCIKAAMEFLRDSVSSSNIGVVISGRSEKTCSLLMKKFNVQREGVVFDSKSRAKDYEIMTIYPVLLSFKEDSWHAVDITPENYKKALKWK
jgi:hypothetical protein